MLAGVAPLPASSGAILRYRLNRSGDRALNRALYLAALSRMAHDPETKVYLARRLAEGKTKPEIRRGRVPWSSGNEGVVVMLSDGARAGR